MGHILHMAMVEYGCKSVEARAPRCTTTQVWRRRSSGQDRMHCDVSQTVQPGVDNTGLALQPGSHVSLITTSKVNNCPRPTCATNNCIGRGKNLAFHAPKDGERGTFMLDQPRNSAV